MLERTHEELREREANYAVCLRYLLERGGKDELVSVLGRVRETLRAELVPLVPRAAARSAATFLKHRSNRSAASPPRRGYDSMNRRAFKRARSRSDRRLRQA